jgi:hypothetical protein
MLWKHHKVYTRRLNISRLFVYHAYIGPASHKIERILRNEAGIKVYHSSENKLFRALCTHKYNVNESQKPGVYRIPCECGLVYIGETGRNLSVYVLRNTRRIARKPSKINLHAVAKHTWTYDHRIKWNEAIILAIDSHKFSRKMRESIEIEKHNTIDQQGKPLDIVRGVLSLMCKINFSCLGCARVN